ncbi:hypothetical protein AVO41_06815 [Thiomicrospira sp. WB1]|nr:hypothetical protein AVO41_06815 [Thiomicrospira sp. WB1]
MDTSQKVVTCLDYIDQRLEDTSEQTIQIAEMIIDDIKELTAGYPQALKDNNLQAHADKVRDTQMKWVNQLQDIILEQTQRDLNGQVIQALQKFAQNLNQTQPHPQLDFDLPSVVQRRDENLAHEYLTQDEIELLMAADNAPAQSMHH